MATAKIPARNLVTVAEDGLRAIYVASTHKAFDAAFAKNIVGSGLPGAPSSSGGAGGSTGGYDSALTPMDEDDRPVMPRARSARKQVISDDEYMTPSDEEA